MLQKKELNSIFIRMNLLQRRGSAIVIVLLFLVLISGLVITFFNFSSKRRLMVSFSTEEIRTMSITRGAVDTIIKDLTDEMESNSIVVTTPSGKKIYQINKPSQMNPSLSTRVPIPLWNSSSLKWSDTQALNLLKQSIHETPFSSTGSGVIESRASSVSTMYSYQNGRRLRPSLWMQPKLMKEDFVLSEEQTPDWIYTTRSGENPIDFRDTLVDKKTLNEDLVIGRYAYQIYDVGGLLDMTVAGFNPQKTPAETIGKKGGILMADLRAIPGLSEASDSKLNELFSWRNKGPWEFIGGFFTYGERYGWRIPFTTPDDNDNTFISRSDLIHYLNSLLGEKVAAKALPYLSTFERTLDTPSYRPNPDRPKIKTDPLYVCNVGGRNPSGGRNTAYGKEDLLNPDLSTTFDLDGTPKLKHRFPLSRLKFVKSPKPGEAPSSSDQKLVTKYFGLEWDASVKCWTIDDTQLKNLKDIDVKSDGEPNFFEVLKAGINAGSLGQSRRPASDLTSTPLGTADSQTGMPTPYGGAYASDETIGQRFDRDRSLDIHILQIGANIIDQADEDGYPTHIKYLYLGNTYDIYGTENIPYPNYWLMVPYRHQLLPVSSLKPSGDPTLLSEATLGYPNFAVYPPYIGAWLTHVGMWNPHRPPSTSNTGSDRPTLFRVTADTDVMKTGTLVRKLSAGHYTAGTPPAYWTSNPPSRLPSYNYKPLQYSARQVDLQFAIKAADLGTDPLGLRYVYANLNYLTPTQNWIKFNTTTAGDASFRMPFTLKTTLYPSGANITVPPTIPIPANSNYSGGAPNKSSPQVSEQPPYRNMEFNIVANDFQNPTTNSRFPWSSTVIGFLHGYFYLGQMGSATTLPETRAISGLGIHFECQYSSDGGATWWPYAEMELPSDNELGQTNISNRTMASGWVDTGNYCGTFPDPRTKRFESFRDNGIRIGNANITTAELRIYEGNTQRTGPGIIPAPSSGNLSFGNLNAIRNNGVTAGTWGSAWQPNSTTATIKMYMDTFTINKQSKMAQSTPVYYEDPDGIVRPGIGVNEQSNGGVGNPMQQSSLSPVPPTDPNDPFYLGRPTILDRPFRSVAELGYVSRAVPWKHIDFSTPTSGDSALLDLFCIEENEDNEDGTPLKPERPRAIAGRVNLNTHHPEVIEALLRGGLKDQTDYLQKSECQKIAASFIDWTASDGKGSNTGKGPLTNVADLVGRLADPSLKTQGILDQGYAGITSQIPGNFAAQADQSVKSRIESVVRSLADGGQVRTWNLMIDLVTQSGALAPKAKSLGDFNVRSEKHHWVHLSIDRITGEVLDLQWETVRE